ncbi:putative redox protein [Cyclobacterium lianum]|uniref:Putative redox protein n=1 Tax=Cyclobacterium lianum TaxID=388280 RepID=A0A1M7QR01_9BACT|nr:OsmC family protein [Cyclobacterium lianum]SHN33996.1 putative redox protein [Cyclobacterium lianum]
MSKKKITLHMIADHEYESVNLTGNTVNMDMYAAADKKHQSPMELLLSGLAGCSAVDTVLMMKKRRKQVSDFKIEAEGIRSEGTPSFYTEIHLLFELTSPDASQAEFEKVVRLAVEKYCSVASSLKSEISFTANVVRPS